MVVNDWGAMSDHVKGFQAGCDLSMPGGSDYMENECKRAVGTRELSEKEIDLSVERILALLEKSRKALDGADCQDIRLSEDMERDGEEWCNIAGEASDMHSNEELKDTAVPSWYKRPERAPDQEVFEELIGRALSEERSGAHAQCGAEFD